MLQLHHVHENSAGILSSYEDFSIQTFKELAFKTRTSSFKKRRHVFLLKLDSFNDLYSFLKKNIIQ